MSPGSEPTLGHILAGGPNWPSASLASRPASSSSNIGQAQLAINTSLPPRSSSLGFSNAMGQSLSKSNNAATNSPAGPPPSPSTPRGLSAAVASGMKLKRAFANRRKKSEDATKTMARSVSRDETSASAQDQFLHQQQRIQATPSSSSSPAKLATQVFNVGSSKKSTKTSSQQQQQLPPPPPPKPTSIPSQQLATPLRLQPPLHAATDPRSSIIPISPGISSAVDYMRMEETARQNRKEQEIKDNEKKAQREELQAKHEEKTAGQAVGGSEKSDTDDKGELKDAWRKSDSTMSHHTIRQGGRPSRPVSMADSLQSNHTIVPVSKRQSALIADADFGMPEEDDSSASADDIAGNSSSHNDITNYNPPTPSDFYSASGPPYKTRDYRSMSLNVNTQATPLKQKLPPTPSSASATNLTYSLSGHPSSGKGPSTGRESSVSPRLPVKLPVYNSPSPPPSTAPVAIEPFRTMPSNPYTTFPPPPEAPPQKKSSSGHDRSLPSLPLQVQPRQPTLSMSSGFGLAKRAVEKMGLGRALGMGSSSPPNAHAHTPSASGYSSSSSGHTTYTNTPPSSYGKQGPSSMTHGHGHHNSSPGSVYFNNELSRTSSGHSSQNHTHTTSFLHKKHRLKHNAHAPSVSSVTSATSASASDSDMMMYDGASFAAGFSMGKQLRGPLKRGGGVVFGRELRSAVRETGVGIGKANKGWSGRWRNWEGESESDGDKAGSGNEGLAEGAVSGRTRKGSVKRGQLKALEDRKLPSLVVRCAQHLLIWGVQEEGLFRIPGRALHVSKLRQEFDSGADYDMTGCSPSDLDPHAVASVFKAYLRELPEPILTNALLPYFDAAMTQEGINNATNDANSASHFKHRGPGLPHDPRSKSNVLPSIRKPPSLSTLAAPNLTGVRPPSKLLLDTFRALLARLPEENRDLIRTVAELIRATALESRETKMPMSNLLLVFCPSLNMNAPLLRILCEAEGIWNEPVAPATPEDGAMNTEKAAPVEDAVEDVESQRDGLDEDGERESLQSESVGRTSEDVPSSVGYLASTEDIAVGSQWGPVPSVHRDGDGSSMSQPSRQDSHDRKPSLASSPVVDDGSSYLSTSEDRQFSDVHSRAQSSPLLTSSAESLETPDTSSLPPLSGSHLPIGDEPKTAKQLEPSSSPVIAESEQQPAELSPVTPRKPIISNPIPIAGLVQFPATNVEDSAPPSPAKIERRRSIPILSLPNLSLGSSTSGNPGTPGSTLSLASRAKRLKKPSLHLLFSKKSSSSISSSNFGSPATSSRPAISNPYLQAPQSASDSSVSTPLSAVTAPQSSPTIPPKLETPIESSSLQLGLGLKTDVYEIPSAPSEKPEKHDQVYDPGNPALPTPPPSRSSNTMARALASAASLNTRSPTPIADRYRSASPYASLPFASSSQLSLTAPEGEEPEVPSPSNHLRTKPTLRSRGLSTASYSATSSRLDLLAGEKPEDWTRSVLLAADADSDWDIQHPTAKA